MADKQWSEKAKYYRFIGKSFNGFDDNGERKEFRSGDKVKLEPDQFESFSDQFEELKSKGEDSAPKADETKPGDGSKGAGAGASANSTNSAKV